MTNHYDIIIIGSGMGGLASSVLLAKEGYKVCVLEKNNQFGGNLQTFVRDKTIIDTGVHYIGGLDVGQNLYRYFQYLGIIDDLQLEKMDLDGYDYITFDDDENKYPHAQGYDNFINQLSTFFPDERKAIEEYCTQVKKTCKTFPLYNLENGNSYSEAVLSLNLKDYLDGLTTNELLKSVLAGSNLIYAGNGEKTPFYVHALSVNSYIKSSWRCIRGGSQIAKLLVKQLRKYKGDIFRRTEVSELIFEGDKAIGLKTTSGEHFTADQFISNIDLNGLLKLSGDSLFRKSFRGRVKRLKLTPSSFTVHIVFKPESFPYLNHNIYHFKKKEYVWNAAATNDDLDWPKSYMISMGTHSKDIKYAEDMSIMTYMDFEKVKEWEETINTVVDKNERGANYDTFKQTHIEIVIKELELKYPDIRQCIKSTYATTPLSYRDYIGSRSGNMYGFEKDSSNPLASLISPRTKASNFFVTGQSINTHGVLGTTIGAVNTCSEIIGKEVLLNKIKNQENEPI